MSTLPKGGKEQERQRQYEAALDKGTKINQTSEPHLRGCVRANGTACPAVTRFRMKEGKAVFDCYDLGRKAPNAEYVASCSRRQDDAEHDHRMAQGNS